MTRKLPVKTQVIELVEEYAGWNFTARINPPIRAFGDVASGDFDRTVKGLAQIIREWNFVDEDGKEMSAPNIDTIGDLTLDLVTAVANRYVEELAKLPPASPRQ